MQKDDLSKGKDFAGIISLVVTGCYAFQQLELVAVGRELGSKRVMHAESS
ncbi:hypothetical protein COMA1_90068 [Candidatus Nitrospira nitrosa]|uniref:Uncharacterized protein n=1 Tax=Candidatus Nitrospira nitrosa TaxID=1742972 RepID=A0A0S4LT68_9BACT|nr:hypothetical protein COMA1_90068 [Candidatus Nitrospira nitrosa]